TRRLWFARRLSSSRTKLHRIWDARCTAWSRRRLSADRGCGRRARARPTRHWASFCF
ncbi:hypothetical protein BGZ98_002627, partial [Dissophora globulifera]